MHIRRVAVVAALACATFPQLLAQDKQGAGPAARDIGQWTETEVETWIRSRLDRGSVMGDDIALASHARSAIVVPLTELKIEEALKCNSSAACFSDPTVAPERFVREAAGLITGAGDESALRATSRLMKLDEAQFRWMVGIILYTAQSYSNAFTVAYRGFAIGDPLIDSRIAEWTEAQLSQNVKSTQQAWAEAMLDRYSVVPNANQWATDPIATRLSPKVLDLVRSNVTRLAAETIEKRKKG